MYEALIGPFVEFAFMRRALVGSLALSFAAAPVGVFLMLRRMSLAGDAMAHAILPGVAAGYLLAGLSVWAMTLGGLVAGIAVALLAGVASRLSVLKEDATLATFYLVSLALGVALVSLRGSNVDLMRVLFGSVLALDDDTLIMVVGTATITLVAFALILRPLVVECVDPSFLATAGGRGALVHGAFLGLVVLNLVAAFNAIGTLLAVGLMMLPAAIGRLWSDDLAAILTIAIGASLFACVAGILASWHLSLPTGPAIILAGGLVYFISLVLGQAGGILRTARPARHLEG